ncbi:MAG: Asp-tRNA(Asn)/Glu-tRNA(Gln) amidotransferase subunit GatA [candidate division WOR-3 bacterium]
MSQKVPLSKVKEIISLYQNKKALPSEVVKEYFEKAKKNEFNSFITLNENIFEEIEILDKKVKEGKIEGRLFGIPVSVKDNILVKGLKCTCASRMLENYIAPYDATCIERIKKENAIIIGKTNMDEFAMGSSNEYSFFGPASNPFDKERVPGGSSGGSAISVANNESILSLGSDTGGSIRLPASFCGVYGLKPTYGAVSRYGLVAFASSLDQIGPFSKNIEDLEIIFNVIKGKDERDKTSFNLPEEKRILQFPLKIGVLRDSFSEDVDGEIKIHLDEFIKTLEKEKIAIVKEFEMETFQYAIPVYYIIACAEASSNLARYDGVLYGYKSESENLWEMYEKTRTEGFGEEVKRRILLGTFVLRSGYYEEYYLKAQKIRTKILKEFMKNFENFDLLLMPVSPTLPFKKGEKLKDPIKMYLSDIFTVSINLSGLPAIAFPYRFSKSGLPVGFQFVGKFFDEYLFFELLKRIENIF